MQLIILVDCDFNDGSRCSWSMSQLDDPWTIASGVGYKELGPLPDPTLYKQFIQFTTQLDYHEATLFSLNIPPLNPTQVCFTFE